MQRNLKDLTDPLDQTNPSDLHLFEDSIFEQMRRMACRPAIPVDSTREALRRSPSKIQSEGSPAGAIFGSAKLLDFWNVTRASRLRAQVVRCQARDLTYITNPKTLYHMGFGEPEAKSTLGGANKHQHWRLWQARISAWIWQMRFARWIATATPHPKWQR